MFQQSDGGGPAAARTVLVDLETVYDHLAKLIKDMGELPTPEQVALFTGASHGVAYDYHFQLGEVTKRASAAAKGMQERLVEADAAIRAAVQALTAQDAGASGAADQLLDALDSAGADQRAAASSAHAAPNDESAGDSSLGDR